jgi:SnoaL-like domain
MENLKAKVDTLNEMILNGKILEAFDQFYADDVVMQDNNYPARIGKADNRLYEESFVNGLTAFRGATVENVIISDGIAVIEWWFDYTHKDYGDRNYKQVSVQRWKDDKIVEEKFYYNS